MRYLVVGFGTVGQAWAGALKAWGHDVGVYDPEKDLEPSSWRFEGAFVCVPTPTKRKTYSNQFYQEGSYVMEALEYIDNKEIQHSSVIPWISIRSTVNPNAESVIRNRISEGQDLIADPEFLRERYADYEASHPRLLVVGGDRDKEYINEVYPDSLSAPVWVAGSFREAFWAKYALNFLFSLKVIYANEADKLRDLLTEDPEINLAEFLNTADQLFAGRHMDPDHGDKPGYGGKCLPKDTKLWYGRGLELLDRMVEINGRLRDWPEFSD